MERSNVMSKINQSLAKLEETAKPTLRAQEEEEEAEDEEEEASREAAAAKRRETGQARIAAAEERLRWIETSLYEATV
jgi:hypothetical protein